MKLILVRHGQTEENKNKIIQGQMPGTLSELGKEQAQALALQLKDTTIDCIYSSDLARSADTAKTIAKYHPNVPIHFVKELRERAVGPYKGKKRGAIVWTDLPHGVEVNQDLMNRVKPFIEKAYSQYPNSTVLIVGHKGINKTIECAVRGLPPTEMKNIPHAPNAGIIVLEYIVE